MRTVAQVLLLHRVELLPVLGRSFGDRAAGDRLLGAWGEPITSFSGLVEQTVNTSTSSSRRDWGNGGYLNILSFLLG
jgi:hypothetical protein